jgi:hypothetical protein
MPNAGRGDRASQAIHTEEDEAPSKLAKLFWDDSLQNRQAYANTDLANNQEGSAMSNVSRPGKRLTAAINLRDAALALLQQKGKHGRGGEGRLVFEEHTPENPTPLLSLSLSKHPLDERPMLNVWAMLKGEQCQSAEYGVAWRKGSGD